MLDLSKSLINGTLGKVPKRLHYPLDIMRSCGRWYVVCPLNLRHVEKMMQKRGVCVERSPVYRWAIKMLPVLAARRAAKLQQTLN
jgi:transposase-like protein